MSEKAMNERKGQSRARGFSAIELVVVAGIILIVAAVSTPALFRYIRTYEIRGAASELAAEIARARMTAVTRNVRYGVVIAVMGNQQYRIVTEDVQDAALRAAAAGASGLYVAADYVPPDGCAACRAQTGPTRRRPARVVFGAHCPGFVGNNSGLRFSRLGLMCQPTGAPAPRNPGDCVSLPAALPALVSFDANGRATFCLADTGRGLARQVTVLPGGRTSIEVVSYVP